LHSMLVADHQVFDSHAVPSHDKRQRTILEGKIHCTLVNTLKPIST